MTNNWKFFLAVMVFGWIADVMDFFRVFEIFTLAFILAKVEEVQTHQLK